MIVDADRLWRLSHIYTIIDKDGRKIRFRPNWAQQELLDNLHTFNVILKARQLGFSTLIQLLALDQCLFVDNTRAGTIAHTMPAATAIFARLKFAYEALDEGIKARVPLLTANATDLVFGNGSSIRVAVSLRGDTLQFLHISEYGKMCAKFPERAREVRTGALNTIQAGNVAFIESTAEGQEGHFYEICQAAQSRQRMGTAHSPLDFKLFFYPWFRAPEYTLKVTGAPIPDSQQKYFETLQETRGIALSEGQRAWYCAKSEVQSGDMKREYPSTAEEAFEASVEGAYYADQIAAAEVQGRIGDFPADPMLPVHTSWDLGIGDSTAIWAWQISGERRRLVGYLENSGEGMPWYIEAMNRLAAERGWRLGDHWLPHDSMAREWTSGRTRFEQFREATMRFPRLVPQESVDDGINAARQIFARCEFDAAACAEGLKALRGYRKEWDEERGLWRDRPRHDWASHGADAFRYFALAIRDARPIVLPEAPRRWLPLPQFSCEVGPGGRMVAQNFGVMDIIEHRTRSRQAREFG